MMPEYSISLQTRWLFPLIGASACCGAYLAICGMVLSGVLVPECSVAYRTPAELGYPDAQLLSLVGNLR